MYIACPDLSENKFISIFVTLKNAPYRLTFKWNEYCDCCFMSIFDSEGNPLNAGNALTTKCIIESDKRLLPDLYFRHKDNFSIEPTAETLKDFVLLYEDTTN